MTAEAKDIDGKVYVTVHGNFIDDNPMHCKLDALNFYYVPTDGGNGKGWFESTKCMNKWRNIGKSLLDELFPNGMLKSYQGE